jgi:hypothetical protein
VLVTEPGKEKESVVRLARVDLIRLQVVSTAVSMPGKVPT